MRAVAWLAAAASAISATAANPPSSAFGPAGNKADQLRIFWHPSESFFTNLMQNGFNTFIVHNSGEYNPKIGRCASRSMSEWRNRWLDVLEGEGVGIVVKMTFVEGLSRAKMCNLVTEGGEVAGRPDPRHPDFMPQMRRAMESVLELVPDRPGVFGVQPSSEVRDHGQPAATDAARALYLAETGRTVPKGTSRSSPAHYTQIAGFPVGRVVPDDDPLLLFYRWWWRDGDGWNVYQSEMARMFSRRFSHPVASFYDPLTRTPPVWGSGGEVTFGNHWVYTDPLPIKVLYAISEQHAMVRGNPGQGVLTMLQGISYRNRIAPKDATPAKHPAWHDTYPNTLYPTTPAALLREGLWAIFARKVDGYAFFGGASLFDLSSGSTSFDEYRKRTYYQFTDPTAMPVVEGLIRSVGVPLGPLLRAIPERSPEVAVLESFSASMFAKRGTWGGGGATFDMAVAAEMASLQPEALYEEDLARDGMPQSVKVLLMPECDVLTETSVRVVRDWQVRTGGVLLADRNLPPAILPDGPLPEIHPVPDGEANAAAHAAAAEELLSRLAPWYSPYASATEGIVVHVRSSRSADYVFAINDKRGYGDYVGPWRRVLDKGLPNCGTVTVNRRAGAVYDLVRHAPAAFSCAGERTEIPVEYDTNDGRLLMVVDKPLSPLSCSRDGCRLTVSSPDAGALVPVEVRFASGRPLYGVVRDGLFVCERAGVDPVHVVNLADGRRYTIP